jgi:hypothetical protein
MSANQNRRCNSGIISASNVCLSICFLVVIGVLAFGPQIWSASTGLVAGYAFGEGSGTTTADISGNLNTGSLSNVTWTTSGKIGSALVFNGSSSRVNINDAASLDLTTGMTLEAWIYPTTSSGWRSVILKESTNGLAYGLYASDDAGRPAVYINTGGIDLSATSSTALTVNSWTHLAATYDGSSLKLYVNGSQAASISTSGSLKATTGALMVGGNAVWGEYFSGTIDETRVYNRALSQSEIQADMSTGMGDTTAPVVTAFSIPAASSTLVVPITTFSATDNVGVSGYIVTETSAAPAASATGWSATAPTSYTSSTQGARTLYGWAKDAAGNVSAGMSATTVITLSDTTPPSVIGFTIPATSTTLAVAINSIVATDNVAVTGFLVNESASTPLPSANEWSVTIPTSYTFASNGTKTLYAWAKDAAGNVSTSKTATVTIASSDATAPTVTAFALPSTSSSLTVSIASYTAIDNVAVTGYTISESSTTPSATSGVWTSSAPASYTFPTSGAKTLYAWAKDAAGNVSAARSASVTITLQSAGPEPAGWYAGDPHVHRSCGGSPETVSTMFSKMSSQKLSVISLLADMGNGEVQNATADLPLVNGSDASVSTSSQILHWDAEWHWDPIYSQYPHHALGGHILALGLGNAQQVWQEYTYPIFSWAHQRNAVAGFAHMQYLDDSIPQTLTCCTPIEYPVEVALGSSDFISEDVQGLGAEGFGMCPDCAVRAYYRLLNTGFRPGFAAGTDYPCNGGADLGSLLTYVQVAGGQMNYRNWIDGIAKGRTVVSRNGHNEFLNLVVNSTATPGDEIKLAGSGSLPITVTWTANQNISGTIELVQNGTVVASKAASVASSSSASLTATVNFSKSGWVAARRVDGSGQHQVQTGAVFITVNNLPVRTSVADAQFYVQWMDNLLENTSPGGSWNQYFSTGLGAAQARYQSAKALFQQIASEAAGTPTTPTVAAVTPVNSATSVATNTALTATFSKAMDSTTIIASGNFTLRDSSNNLVPSTVSYNATSYTATLVPSAALSYATTYTATISTAVKDTSGASPAAAYAWSFATASQSQGGTFTIWPATAVPAVVADNDTTATEVGVKFRSSAAGYITGLRFYKSSTNTGTHTGSLWTSTGTLLASTTFTNETASGWQQANLSTPISIAANTIYVASYHTNSGHYSEDDQYFATSGVTNGPLEAVSNTVSPPNGLYVYTDSGAFPTLAYNSANYWVDVVFSSSSTDANSPTVTAFSLPSISSSLTVPFSSFAASDNVGVTGYLVTESATVPPATDSGWSSTIPASYTFTTAGIKTLYAWAKDAAGNVSAGVSASVTISIGDAINPTVTTVFPASNATGIARNAKAQVTFSEAMSASTISASTIYLRRASNNASVTATVTYDATTNIATLQPSASLVSSIKYTVYVTGGSSGSVKDLAGNSLAATYSWSFTTGSSTDSTKPTITSVVPASGATGISINSPVTATFSEAMDATTVVPSTFQLRDSSSNLIPATISYSSSRVATLTASAALTSSTQYTATIIGGSTDPRAKDVAGNALAANRTWSFTTAAVDTIPPTITSVVPANGATGISINPTVTATFSEAMDPSTIGSSTFGLRDSSGNLVSATISYNSSPRVATLTPSAALANSTQYTATITGGATDPRAKDLAGNALAANRTWSFTTAAGSPGGGSAEQPVLLITSSGNQFSTYYSEILLAEGLNHFETVALPSVTSTVLANHDIAILGEMPLTASQVSMFTQWVTSGGKLIAMKPDKQLAGLLGLTSTSSTMSDEYILVNTSSSPGAGIVNQTVQYHGPADLYTVNGATKIATIYSSATLSTPYPAVTINNYGSGQAAAFTYDLAKSIVYTRQGNPVWAGVERDGQTYLRAGDMFFPGWIDIDKVAIPQADEQQRLLANMIIGMNIGSIPLPRFWYFPRDLGAVVVMTGDDHKGGGTAGRFQNNISDSPANCSVDNWDCVRSTSYVFDGSPLTNAQAVSYQKLGFEVAMHLSTGAAIDISSCGNWSPSTLATFFSDQLSQFKAQYPGVDPQVSHRTHCIAWTDYTTMAEQEAGLGIRMDTNYYYWPPDYAQYDPGFFTGSGLAMRFAKSDGTLLDIYQAATQMTDESGQSYPYTINALLDNAVGSAGYYGAFVANMHTDSADSAGSDAIIASAQSHGIPVISARQLLTWLDGRNSSTFDSISWNGNILSFSVTAGTGANGLRAMVPIPAGLRINNVTLNGSQVTYGTATIKGINYVYFQAPAGSYTLGFGQ